LQRLPGKQAQHEALKRRGERRFVVSSNEIYGTLRAQLEYLREADALEPPSRGPKPKRTTLLKILDLRDTYGVAEIRTSIRSPLVARVAKGIGKSPEQTRDLLHQLKDMEEKLVDTTNRPFGSG
jgi:hypothetical protein